MSVKPNKTGALKLRLPLEKTREERQYYRELYGWGEGATRGRPGGGVSQRNTGENCGNRQRKRRRQAEELQRQESSRGM